MGVGVRLIPEEEQQVGNQKEQNPPERIITVYNTTTLETASDWRTPKKMRYFDKLGRL